MRKLSRRFSNVFFAMVVAHMPSYVVSQMAMSHAADPSQAESSKESAYQETERDGRLYVFTSSTWLTDFEKSGELGKAAVIKIGYGPNGETVVFDSDEAVKEYNYRRYEK
ncbi:MAG: hypothetical protein E3K32_10660 [wastewater metagenome]|nr:hypothetical protein [Candidatus Brocadia sp.]MCF6159007.1 hypothetical protein [Candidatus Loosdrechtia aerotolerans]